jgi:DNA-directed RNA polymerase specialized sigma subunit
VDHLARRFRNRGEPLDDLVQVGTIGLIKSVDRFELDRGVEFSTYATPTVTGQSMADSLGADDEALEGVDYRESLKPLLAQLDPRAKHILMLRFFRGMTQSQIAGEVGISQMHVSRILSRTLAQLRAGLID